MKQREDEQKIVVDTGGDSRLVRKFENITVGGTNYYLAKIQIWYLALIPLFMLCLASAISTAKIGSAEADGYVAPNTAGMTDKEAHDAIADPEKEIRDYIKHESGWLLSVPNRILASIINIKTWDWSKETCVSFLTWVFWSVVTFLLLARTFYRGAYLMYLLKRARNSGKMVIRNVSGYKVPFTGKGLFIIAVLMVAFMAVLLGAPVWVVYLALAFLLHKEKQAFKATDGIVYDPPRQNILIETLREWGVCGKLVRYVDNLYGYNHKTSLGKRGRHSRPPLEDDDE